MPFRSLLFIAALFAFPALVGAAALPVTYTVEEKPLKAAVAGTILTFELYTDSACSGPIAHSVTMPIEDVNLIARITPFHPKKAPKKPNAAELRTTLTAVRPASAFYLKVTGTGIAPLGGACQAEPAAGTPPDNGCLNILHYGGSGNDTTPNDTAFNDAFAALPASGAGCIYFPPGTYRFNSAINKAIHNDTAALTIRGDGPRVSELHFPNSSGGIHISRDFYRVHVAFLDFSLTTGQAGTATGIDLTSSGVTIPTSGWNTISNVYLGGDDWRTAYSPTNYWSIAIHIALWGQFNITNVNTIGKGGNDPASSGGGAGLFIEGAPAPPEGILYNISQSSFNLHNYGIIYGNCVQGVTINQCNFNGHHSGAAIIAGGGYNPACLLSQLGVFNSQFDYGGSAIVLLTTVFDVELGGNIFSAGSSGAVDTRIVDLHKTHGFNITGNKFFMYTSCNDPNPQKRCPCPSDPNCPATYGLVVDSDSTNDGFGTIVGNTFADVTNGYKLGGNVRNVTAGLNSFANVPVPVIDDSGGSNSIGEQSTGGMAGVVP